jgi:polyisoprenoid-binding protein YceI
MKRITITTLALALGLAATASAADTWTIDKAHSEVTFKIKHLMSKVSGSFNDFDGTITTDFTNLGASGVSFTIQAASIDTKNADRDKHLRSADFFDVEKFPTITFTSSKITTTGNDTFAVTGTFTMHGVSKEVTLPVTFLGAAQDPWGNTKAGFEVTTSLKRSDYGIVWNKALETGGFLLGDEVAVTINLEVAKK